MDMNTAFPSDYLKAGDLQGKEITVTMANVELVTMGDEEKPVLHFQGTSKGMVLNKTNTRTIMDMYGPESDNWHGKQITLIPAQTDFQGRQVACVRVKVGGLTAAAPAKQEPQEIDETDYSEVPF